MTGLSGKTAIVTGGGTGIGRGIAIALAREGVRVLISGRRRAPLEQTRIAIQEVGGECLATEADVSSAEDVQRLVQTALDAFGVLDILINNAGIGGGAQVHEHEIEDWDQVLAVNLRGPFLLSRAVLPSMRAQRSGQIVNISSESGLEHYRGDGAYGVAKHALNALAQYIQRENQEHGIRVFTICPGMVVTEMTKGTPGLNEEKCLYPEDLSDLVIWLLSRRPNVKIGTPILLQTMQNPWQ